MWMAADIATERLHISANGGTKQGEFTFVPLVRKSTFLSRRPQCLLKSQTRRESHSSLEPQRRAGAGEGAWCFQALYYMEVGEEGRNGIGLIN